MSDFTFKAEKSIKLQTNITYKMRMSSSKTVKFIKTSMRHCLEKKRDSFACRIA